MELKAKIREEFGRKTNSLRRKGKIPAILYGEGIKNIALKVDKKEFEEVFEKAGESSMIKLKIEDQRPKTKDQKSEIKEIDVLIHDIQQHPLTQDLLHVDFYHPSSKKKVTAEIPLVFEGEAPAAKELGGTLIREIQTVEVEGLAQNLPREIKVDVAKLKTFEDRILIEDLKIPQGIKILKEPKEIVALVSPPEERIEEEKPVEEKPEEEKPEEKKGEKKEEQREEKQKEEKPEKEKKK